MKSAGWVVAAYVLVVGSAHADDKKAVKAPPQSIGTSAADMKAQTAPPLSFGVRKPLKCAVYGSDLTVLNDTGVTLHWETYVSWEVSGVPASCCKGHSQLQWTLPPNNNRTFNGVIHPPQSSKVPCSAWAIAAPYGANYAFDVQQPIAANQTFSKVVKVQNQGTLIWPANGLFRLSYHWYKAGSLVNFEGERTVLPLAVPPGGYATLNATVKAPSTPGTYTLKWDMVQEGVTWFSWKGVPPFDMTVAVTP